MPQAPIEVEDLLRFIDQLRLAGFDISPQQCVAAQNVLLALAAHGCWPNEPSALRTWLAPVICSSPREQENFYRRFDHWVEQREPISSPGPKPTGPEVPPYFQALRVFVGLVRPRIRKFVLTAGTALAIIVGVILLLPRIPRTLSGQVIDQDTKEPVVAANVLFSGKISITDQNGAFKFSYREKELPQDLIVTSDNYESKTQQVVSGSTLRLVVPLQSVGPPPPPPPPTPSPTPSATPQGRPSPSPPDTRGSNAVIAVPIPTLMPAQSPSSHADSPFWRWIGYGLAVLPLIVSGLWFLWQKKLRLALLEKFRTAARPRLEQIVVKGTASHLFMGQSFRHTVQDLRRHRQRGASELDVQRTVETTIKSGGLFSPRYSARQTLPEYLVLIDRAGFEDQQARLHQEIVRRLAQDNVLVDAYFFHGDPRVCRKHESSLQYVTLQDLAAMHRDHHLVIFTNGSSFLNPFSGAPDHWVEIFAQWARRAILTPEPPVYWGHREWMLAQTEFVILPATREGLAALSELVDVGATPTVDIDPLARPYPSLLIDRESRWLEDLDPRPAEVERLRDQLKLYLGEKGYFWLSACAVYPVLHWDLTLYFGFKLFGDGSMLEERILSLVRLPWFRYGAMPDWLRLRLISEMSTQEERAVRRVLEELFLTVLERPTDGINIQFASEKTAPESLLEKFWKKTERWKFRRLFWRFVKDETSESPLRDYVFVSFMAGRKPRKLAISLPQAIRQLFFPQGQAALGLRPTSGLTLSVVCSLVLSLLTWHLTQPPIVKATSQLYLEMSSQEQAQFIRETATQISQTLDGRAPQLSDDAIASIKSYVDYYAYRVGNKSSERWLEDLCVVFGRATQIYAPTIISDFEKKKVSVLLGLYIPMSYSEFIDYQPYANIDTAGIFQLTSSQARRYGLSPEDRYDVTKAAPVAADVLVDMSEMVALDSRFPSVLILSYKRGPNQIRSDAIRLYPESTFEPTCWDFQANASRLDSQFQKDEINYVPKFFAAAIVGENPRRFGLDMNPLSTSSTFIEPTAIEQQIADLVAKFSGDDRRKASDQLIQLYAENKQTVVTMLVNAILSNDPNPYRVNLYIARTLGSIPPPGWDGTFEQFKSVLALKYTREYADQTFKYWVDKATGNFNVKTFIDCDCANLRSGILTDKLQRECSRVESQLHEQFRITGNITDKCSATAQGPNAKPSDRRQAVPAASITVTAIPLRSPSPNATITATPATSPTPVTRFPIGPTDAAPRLAPDNSTYRLREVGPITSPVEIESREFHNPDCGINHILVMESLPN